MIWLSFKEFYDEKIEKSSQYACNGNVMCVACRFVTFRYTSIYHNHSCESGQSE